MYKSGDQIGGVFPVVDPATGELVAADAPGPAGTLEINGVDNAAVVTISTTGTTGKYKWTCTLPAGIAEGQNLEIWIGAAVTVAGGNKVWQGVGCTKRPADIDATTNAAAMLAIAKAQRIIDQTTTPWQLVLKDRDTGAELYRYDLLDADGDGIDSIETFVAQQTTPA